MTGSSKEEATNLDNKEVTSQVLLAIINHFLQKFPAFLYTFNVSVWAYKWY